MPSREEYDEGLGNLAKAGRKVDFIVSHCAPAHVQDIVTDGLYKHDNLTLYLESQSQTVSFEKWFLAITMITGMCWISMSCCMSRSYGLFRPWLLLAASLTVSVTEAFV